MTRILVTGANGLVGNALVEELKNQGYIDIYPVTRDLCDLTDFPAVKALFQDIRPDIVFHNAATVFGIGGNLKNQGAIFLDNILLNTHVVEASRLSEVKKIIAMGTIATYPDPKIEPVKEEQIWEGPPHKSEISYGHAKRTMLAQLLAYHENYGMDFAYVISTNLYGPNDRFDVQFGHVIPSLIRKFYEAKQNGFPVCIWGDGTAARDFLYSKDMARALILVMKKYSGCINVASGEKVLIKDVVEVLSDYFSMQGKVEWDSKMPNGRKFYEIDLTRLKSIGFEPVYSYKEGLLETLHLFNSNYEKKLIRH